MGWFNYYGLAVMAMIMIPNIVYAVRHRNDPVPHFAGKALTAAEQVGRYGCFIFMIFNIPYTWFGFWFEHALAVYLSVNGGLCFAYIVFWIACRKNNGKLRALSLSITPACIFLFCGIMLASIPLLACSVLFAVCHITVSYVNAVNKSRRKKQTVEQKYAVELLFIFVLVLAALTVVGIIFGNGTGSVFPLT